MKTTVILGLCLLLTACKSSSVDAPHWDYYQLSGTVDQVRILQATDTFTRDDDHPIAGAIIGHALAGKTGAFVGAIAGSGRVTTAQVTGLRACELFIKTETAIHKFNYTVQWPDTDHPRMNGADECALRLPGDKEILYKHQFHNSRQVLKEFISLGCANNWGDECWRSGIKASD